MFQLEEKYVERLFPGYVLMYNLSAKVMFKLTQWMKGFNLVQVVTETARKKIFQSMLSSDC